MLYNIIMDNLLKIVVLNMPELHRVLNKTAHRRCSL